MESNKYFTPDIEDLHVGYEFEMKVFGEEETWLKMIFSTPDFTSVLNKVEENYSVPKVLRVPYLTKEQIEAELNHDWKFNESTATFKNKIIKETFILNINIYYNFFFKKLQVKVIEEYEEFNKLKEIEYNLFNGECKDINTFRKIIKLLGI